MSNKKIIEAILSDDVAELTNAFNENMVSKIHGVMEDKKKEIAASYFAKKD